MPPASLSSEFRLVLAATIWPPSAARNETIKNAAAGAIDWHAFLRMVNRHRVWGFVRASLNDAGIKLPASQAEALDRQAFSVARGNLTMAAETLRLQRAFDDSGIDACFVKGVTAAVSLFGAVGLRHGKDIDLLVKPDRIENACRLLEGQGYLRIMPPASLPDEQFRIWSSAVKECEFAHIETGLRLELHWQLVDNPHVLARLDPFSAMQRVELGNGGTANTLSHEAQFAYLCVHGARHGWARLKWLVDIAAIAAAGGPDATAALTASARRLGSGRSADQALLLCETLWGTRLPAEFSVAARRDRRTRWLVAAAWRTLLRGNAQTEVDDAVFGTFLVQLSLFLLGSGVSYHAAQLKYAMTSYKDIVKLQLPNRLTFLYPLLRLPMWAWRRLRVSAPARRVQRDTD